MKFQYLGTAAAEGIPAIACNCKNCVNARRIGGRALRSRSQAVIDNKLLIDFPADTLLHTHTNGIDILEIIGCLVTHGHADHLVFTEFENFKPGFSHAPAGWHMTFYGSEIVKNMIDAKLNGEFSYLSEADVMSCKSVDEFVPTVIGGYTVTPLRAIHDAKSGPFIYQISDGKSTVLYGNDTGYFDESVWNYWTENRLHFDMVSLDCTNASLPLNYVGHMDIAENIRVRERMLSMGIADSDTKFVCNHFSHNGTNSVYDDFVTIAAKAGFLVSYDGMTINL